jgi:hypothetical protein
MHPDFRVETRDAIRDAIERGSNTVQAWGPPLDW